MEILKKLLTWCVLPAVIVCLAYLCYSSVMKPVTFNKEKAAREQVAVQRLKDIRTLQNAFKSANLHYASTIDSLKWFYNEGKIDVVMQIGSQDDSIAMVNTKKVRARNPRITPEQMYELYLQGEKLVFAVKNAVAVKDTLCKREDFCIDSIAFIPCCGDSVMMETTIKTVSGVKVPLFEAKMPYGVKGSDGRVKEYLLKGMDHQLIVNLCAEREDTDRYPGLMVGSVTTPNNNAGNWE
ncbi:MAG: hypothetical protein MJY67_08555 [Bacteroidales bacterium]|nr:hypothetical protein [Bacteroidales bacterium]